MADIILPDPGEGFEYIKVKKETPLIDKLKAERDKLTIELSKLTKPSNEELVEWGKALSMYFSISDELEIIKSKIKEIEK